MANFSSKNIMAGYVFCLAVSGVLLIFYAKALSETTHSGRMSSYEVFFIKDPQIRKEKTAHALERLIKPSISNQTKVAQNLTEADKYPKEGAQLPVETVRVKISNRTSGSYRSLPSIQGWMETNKMHDDYNYCPRVEPFLGPYKFIEKAKNPCWWDDRGVLRCLPYFYVAGFSKCGTTDLFYRIHFHPAYAPTKLKEKHWFDYHRFVENLRFIDNFTDTFAPATVAIKDDLNKTGASSRITGDGTPCYVWGSLNWPCYEGNEGLNEPLYTNADVIYRMNPKSKIIIMLREPADRLYSRMLTWMREPLNPVYVNSTPEGFHSFIEERIAMHQECFKQSSVRQCAYNGTLYKEAVLRLMEGAYSIYIKDWLKVFPRQQLLFIRCTYPMHQVLVESGKGEKQETDWDTQASLRLLHVFEDYTKNLRQTMEKVFSFLELDPLSEEQMQKLVIPEAANKGKGYSQVGVMLNKTRVVLRDFYRPFTEELPKILGDPNFTWDYPELLI